MTLIWSIAIPAFAGSIAPPGHSVLALGADTIISAPRPPKRQITLQSVGKLGSGQYGITDFRQKLTIINDNLVLAWAGSVKEVRFVVRYLRYKFRHDDMQGNETCATAVHRIFKEFRAARRHLIQRKGADIDVNFVGFLAWRGVHRSIGFGHRRIVGRRGITAQAAGTGVEWLERYVCARTATDEITQPAAHLHAHLLLDETETQENLTNAFGGFFEVVFYDGRFEKLDRLLVIIMESTDEHPRPTFFKRFSYQQYDNDDLLVHIFNYPTFTSTRVKISSLFSVEKYKTTKVPFVPRTVCFIQTVRRSGRLVYHYEWLYDVERIAAFKMPSQPFAMNKSSGRLTAAKWFLDWREQEARGVLGLPGNPSLPTLFPYG